MAKKKVKKAVVDQFELPKMTLPVVVLERCPICDGRDCYDPASRRCNACSKGR